MSMQSSIYQEISTLAGPVRDDGKKLRRFINIVGLTDVRLPSARRTYHKINNLALKVVNVNDG